MAEGKGRDSLLQSCLALKDGMQSVLERVPATTMRGRVLSPARLRVLELFGHQSRLSIGAMARRTGISLPAASSLVRGMVADGLLWRRPDEDDRRTVWVGLTAAGRSARASIRRAQQRRLDGVLRRLKIANAERFGDTMRRLADAFTQADGSLASAGRRRGGTRRLRRRPVSNRENSR